MTRKLLLFLLTAIILTGGGLVLWQRNEYWTAERLQERAREVASVPEREPTASDTPLPDTGVSELPEESAQVLPAPDLAALRQVNPDVLGWIHIPDSPVDYPLLTVEDNEEYLRRAWDGTPNRAGCIFLECRNSPDFSDFNTLIYGHYMRDGTMFGSLHEYGEEGYRDTHPHIYIITEECAYRYTVFAAYEAEVVSDTYRLVFADETQKWDALDDYRERSVVDSGIEPAPEDRILTLSTCMGDGTYDTRWVVQAVLTGEFF